VSPAGGTAHLHPAVEENPFAGQGAVLLDIGGDIGAIVVEMPAEMVGVEIEVRPAGPSHQHGDQLGDRHGDRHGHEHDHHGQEAHSHHPHVAVVDRQGPDGSIPSLVFGELREGTYDLMPKGGGPAHATATVRGNEVTQLTWPTRT
jgi:hypothetical protein